MKLSFALGLSALFLSSCSGEDILGVRQPVPLPKPQGDQSAFSTIDVRIRVSEYESRDYDIFGQLPHPIYRGYSAYIEINGGTREGRVAGLSVFADGKLIDEIGSAADPQHFDYQYYLRDWPMHKRSAIEFRYRDATFSLQTESLLAEIRAPETDESISADQPLIVRWTGEGAEPPASIAATRSDSGEELPCRIRYTLINQSETEATYSPSRLPADANNQDPPCIGELIVTWDRPSSAQVSPFRALHIDNRVKRIRRFRIE